MLKDALRSHANPAEEIVLAFGPEGGWTESELQLFREANWTSASLGQTHSARRNGCHCRYWQLLDGRVRLTVAISVFPVPLC